MSEKVREKVRENRLRRTADRRGLRLVKSRRRDFRADDFGRYMLVSLSTGAVVAGANELGRAGFELDDVEQFFQRGGR